MSASPLRDAVAWTAPLLVVAVACSAPWAFGSVEARWWAIASAACLGAAAVALVFAGVHGDPRDDLPVSARRIAVALPVVALIGLAPIPPTVRALLSPRAASILSDAGAAAADSWRPISLDPRSTLGAAIVAAACAAAFWVVGRAARDDRRRAWCTASLLVGAAALAVFGLVQRSVAYDPQAIYWSVPLPDVATPFGPYVNRNHFAGAMLLFAGIGVGSTFHAASSRRPVAAAASVAAAAAALTALVATTSRGALVGLAAGTLFLVAASRADGRGRAALWTLAAAAVVALALAALGLFGDLVARFHLSPEGRELNRFAVQRDALRVFVGAPVFGTGAGTFAAAYPPFQTVDDARFFNNAHSDWAQFLMETGIVGAAFALAVSREAWRRLRVGAATGRANRWLVLGPAAGCLAMCVHGFFEVNLHVPANALLFAVTLSLAFGASVRDEA